VADYNVPRDHLGRPMLYAPTGGDNRIPYTRVSTLAKILDDKEGLISWTAAMALVGIVKSPSLQARVASLIAKTRRDVWEENKKPLKEIVMTATGLAQAQAKADFGTAVHEFTEVLHDGTLDWDLVPESLKGPVAAYLEATESITVLDREVFVTLDAEVLGDEVRAAGSLDRVIHHPDLGVVVGDVKTGANEHKYPLGVTTQIAIYSRGQRYRDAVFEGSPPFDDGTPNDSGTAWRKPIHDGIRTDVGLLIHCPLNPDKKGRYICDLYALDLNKGWRAVELGRETNRFRSGKGLLEKL